MNQRLVGLHPEISVNTELWIHQSHQLYAMLCQIKTSSYIKTWTFLPVHSPRVYLSSPTGAGKSWLECMHEWMNGWMVIWTEFNSTTNGFHIPSKQMRNIKLFLDLIAENILKYGVQMKSLFWKQTSHDPCFLNSLMFHHCSLGFDVLLLFAHHTHTLYNQSSMHGQISTKQIRDRDCDALAFVFNIKDVLTKGFFCCC